jgi:hypothetical protein
MRCAWLVAALLWLPAARAETPVAVQNEVNYLVAKNRADSTEHVIERAATQSSSSGKPYQIRCADGVAVNSQPWMRDMLVQLRALQ